MSTLIMSSPAVGAEVAAEVGGALDIAVGRVEFHAGQFLEMGRLGVNEELVDARSRHNSVATTCFQLTSSDNAGMNTTVASSPVVTSSPDVLSGTAVFAGTRVPVQALFDYLEGGDSIDDFLAGFPTVSRAQVLRILEAAKEFAIARSS